MAGSALPESAYEKLVRGVRQLLTQRLVRVGLLGWIAMMGAGWLNYLPFVNGYLPGVHGLAWAYSYLAIAAVLGLMVTVLILPVMGAGLLILLVLSAHSDWRAATRRGAKVLVLIMLVQLLVVVALVPSLVSGYAPGDRVSIPGWHQTYRTVYVSFPLDDNYGDLMLLQCINFGLCRQVYRDYTDVGSAAAATFQVVESAQKLGLKLEGQWVYVRSPGQPPCTVRVRSLSDYGKCAL